MNQSLHGPSGSPEHDDLVRTLSRGLADRYADIVAAGAGGMAVVFRARDLRHGNTVALKVLRPEVALALGEERFAREIRIEASLNHPHVLQLLDSGSCEGLLYFAAVWAEDGSLRERISAGPMPMADSLRIVREVADALTHVHERGFVHRDVKPENILFRSGHAMLADFGIARAVAGTELSRITDSGVVIGTPHYMSPEQSMGSRAVDARADQYALACILFEMLTGDPPFTGSNRRAVLARAQVERAPSLETIRPELPPSVGRAIARALAKEPADRYASVADFVKALDATVPEQTPEERSRRWRRSLAAVAVVAGAVIAVWALRPGDPTLAMTNVTVLPLAVRGVVSADSGIGIGVAYLLEAALERAEPLRLIDVTSDLSEAELLNPERVTSARARRLARDARSAWLIRGAIQGHPDSVTVLLRLHSVAGDSLVRQVSASGASATSPLHRIAVDALKELLPLLVGTERTVDLAPLRERNAASLALWMQGERRYREARFAEARSLFERALAADSALALAAVRAAQAASWTHDRDAALVFSGLAVERSEHLPSRYVDFAVALGHSLRGHPDSAIARLMTLESGPAGWAEAAAAIGEVRYHQLTDRVRTDQVMSHFRRAIDADSGFAPPLFHLAEDALRRGDETEGRALLERFRARGPDPRLLASLELMLACRTSEDETVWMRHVVRAPVGVFEAAKSLSAGAWGARCAELAFSSLLGTPSSSEGVRWGAFLGLQGLLIAQGRGDAARRLIDSVAAAGKGVARSLYVLGSLSGAEMSVPARELDSFARMRYGEDYGQLRSTEALWVLSHWHLRNRDVSRLEPVRAQLRRRADSTSSALDVAYADASDAHLLLSRGDTSGAIVRLRDVVRRSVPGDITWGFGAALAPDRLLLAQLLLDTGSAREAEEVAAAFDHAEPVTFLQFVAPSLVIRHRAALRRNDQEAANAARRRLEQLQRHDLIS